MSFRDFIAGAVIDGAEAIGATGISQTDGFVNTVINYLSPTQPMPQPRGYSQLGGFFSAPDRVPRRNATSSTYWEAAERGASRVISQPSSGVPPSYQGKAFYENRGATVDELRLGMKRGDNKYMREEPGFAPPTRAAPTPFTAKTTKKIKEGLDRRDDKFLREKPAFDPPTRKAPKPRRKREMQPPSLQ